MPAKKIRRKLKSSKTKTKTIELPKEEECNVEPENFENYQLGDKLGKGAFGSVYQGLDVNTGGLVAIKTIALQKAKGNLTGIQNEIELMSGLNNEHIVKYIGSHKTKYYLYIIMEFAEGGSLQHMQKKFTNFGEHLAATYIYQVLLGLKYLHSQSIIHRDIKAANILISNNIAKLSDFGISVNINDSAHQADMSTQLSAYWSAPEVINMEPITEKSDIWSLGITAIEMFSGEPPYFNLAPIPAMFKIVQNQETPLPDGISSDFKEFLLGCLTRDVTFRKTIDELINSRWIQRNLRNEYGNVNISKSLSAHIDDFIEKSSDDLFDNSDKAKNDSDALLAFADDDDGFDIDSSDEASLIPMVKSQTFNNKVDFLSLDDNDESDDKIDQNNEVQTLDDFVEDDNDSSDDGFDVFDDSDSNNSKPLTSLVLTQPTKTNRKGIPKNLDDIFEDDDDQFDQQTKVMKNTITTLNSILQMIDNPDMESQVKASCDNLINTFKKEKFVKEQLSVYHGVIPIVEIVQTHNQKLLEIALPMIIYASKGNMEMLISMCIIGILPYLFEYVVEPEYSENIQIKSLKILRNICAVKMKPLQMFIAAGGLTKLSQILELHPYLKYPKFTIFVVDIIDSVFTFKCDTPKSCFARIMAQSNLIDHLVDRYVETDDQILLEKLCKIFETFSNADTLVKLKMATPEFIDKIFKRARFKWTKNKAASAIGLSDWNLFFIMQMINNLTLNPDVVSKLWETELAKMLSEYLKIDKNNYDQFTMNPTLNICFSALFNLSRSLSTNKFASIAPLIPFLTYIIRTNHKLKSLAIPLFLEFVNLHSNNKNVRIRLEQNNGLDTLFHLYKVQLHKDQIIFSFSQWAKNNNQIIYEYLHNHMKEFMDILINTIENETPDQKTLVVTRATELCDIIKPLELEMSQDARFLDTIINQMKSDKLKDAPEARAAFSNLILQFFQIGNDNEIRKNAIQVAQLLSEDASSSVRSIGNVIYESINSNEKDIDI
ncbi:MAP3K epsilon protein kinase 1-like isoform X1 [Histomonas meleagridis]|uniref:MAP3K epsilon protein kinase 1-like isoform X1 n=1 Tax=Histomonas meleagridis TaxID=135588 RepID=UPI00355A1770|nr:MAP3K epsilon protein kinase 1-like isoform X1 [Histomonas meleagridis]KAH0798082.1 MAP3K epsilon protein kinase 1-like isoform X1 [Histomonas meleagridis]